MKILTVQQIRKVEEMANEMGLGFLRLMENAGSASARFIINRQGESLNGKTKVVVVCGKGKNAGDGFVIARKLHENGINATILLASGAPTASESIENFTRARGLNINVIRFDIEYESARKSVNEADIIVDCIFGIGFYGQPSYDIAEIFSMISDSKAIVYSIDVPSGVETDTGKVGSECVKADITIAISTLKLAHVTYPAAMYCGDTSVLQIGIPDECFDVVPADYFCADDEKVRKFFPRRLPWSNKGDFGKVLIICGSYNMPGAACFAANAAVRSGAGLVTLAFPNAAYPAISSHVSEPILLPLDTNSSGTFSKEDLPGLIEAVNKADVVALGCGIGLNDDTRYIVQEIIKNTNVPLILDADGINAICGNIDILKASKAPVILTPHPGEMARLCGLSTDEIQRDRLNVASNFSKEHNVTLVLKGSATIVASPEMDGQYINCTGNPGMSTGGSGDVLCGMIAAFAAKPHHPGDAAVAAVYLHGAAGDCAADKTSMLGMTPTDIINELPLLLS